MLKDKINGLIKINDKGYALPYCKDMYLVNYYYGVSANNFYKYLNIDEKKKKAIKNYFHNMSLVNKHRKEEMDKINKEQENERIEILDSMGYNEKEAFEPYRQAMAKRMNIGA